MLNIVIPMAGRGSRFAEAGYSDPKPLILIENKRMIDLVIKNLTPKVDHRFIFICQAEHVEKFKIDQELRRWAPGCEVVCIDGITEGAACTVLCAKELINSSHSLMIANSDQWIDADIDAYLEYMTGHGLDGLIMTMKANDEKWSYAKVNDQGYVIEVVEKVVVSDEATVGVYNFARGRDFVKYAELMIERKLMSNGEYYVAPIYTLYCDEEDAKVGVYNIGSEGDGMYGLGTPADLERFKSLDVCRTAVDF